MYEKPTSQSYYEKFFETTNNCITNSIIVILESNYGTNFNILFMSIFIFLKSPHSVPCSDSLILAINNRISINQLFTNNFQASSVYLKITWSCLLYYFEIVLDKDHNNRTEY